MNTTENNKIIAEFMGLSYCEKNQFEGWYRNHEHNQRVYDLLYHSDWNWLMEVVEKIISLKDTYAQERQKVFNSISPNIQTTYNACLEFIKWYNQQIQNDEKAK